jgi:hypothetical protein
MMNRETWLNNLANLMAPRFEELGFPIPKFRVAVGWTSAGKTSKVGGECWHSSNSADKVFEILCAPIIDDSMHVAAILAHELSHAAAGFKHGHKGDFAKLMAALGLQRPFTQSISGPQFEAWVQPFLDKLGKIPHARIMLQPERQVVGDDSEGDEAEDGEGGSSNQKKKQTTRMLKAACSADVDGQPCGYTVRLSKKWALQLGACCPVHGAMEVEGADELGGDDDADQ